MFSVASESLGSAVRELRDEFGRELEVERIGPDIGVVATTTPKVGEVAVACVDRPLVFLRHLTVEMVRVPRPTATNLEAVAAAARSAIADNPVGAGLAVQTWVSGSPKMGYSSSELFSHLAQDLSAHGFSVSKAGRRHVLSCCIAPVGVSIGLNRAEDSLSDWPGGRVRLSRDEAQVSRAEFKLEELLQTFSLRLPARGRAVDLGASPGGWTRILRRHGLTVWAVDPGALDPRIATDPGVRHVRTTAGEFLRSSDLRFDLAVNDMRMSPVVSCQVMLDAAPRLRPGALAVITLKLGAQRPVETVRRCLELLGRAYSVLHARQLHHNRHEVTVVVRRPTR